MCADEDTPLVAREAGRAVLFGEAVGFGEVMSGEGDVASAKASFVETRS